MNHCYVAEQSDIMGDSMKKLSVFLLVVFVIVTGCSKSTTSSSEFSNSLILGTGMLGFTITGETTSFTGSPVVIYWRLESKDDMKGSAVDISIEQMTDNGYVTKNTFNYPAIQSYGHIMVSSFAHYSGKGSFRATGKLTDTNKTVASKEYTVK